MLPFTQRLKERKKALTVDGDMRGGGIILLENNRLL